MKIGTITYIEGGRAEILYSGNVIVNDFKPFGILHANNNVSFRDMVHGITIASVGGSEGSRFVAGPVDDLRADGIDAGLKIRTIGKSTVVNCIGNHNLGVGHHIRQVRAVRIDGDRRSIGATDEL